MPARNLTLAQAAKLETEQLIPLMRQDFDTLATVAVADATEQHVRPSTKRLLRKRDWHLAWLDALTYAEGELRVSVEIMTATGDPRAEATADRLRRIRGALIGARKIAADFRRRAHRARLKEEGFYSTNRTARSLLVSSHTQEFDDLTAASRAKLPEQTSNAFEAIERGCAHGWLNIPRTSEVERLLDASGEAVRKAAAADARHQNGRNHALRHPLLLRRWHQALVELAEMTQHRAGATSAEHLGPFPPHADTLSEEERSQLFRARRFMAAVLQRRIECSYQIRWAAEAVDKRRQEDPVFLDHFQAVAAAENELMRRYPAKHAYILQRLAPYEWEPGHIDTKHTPEDIGDLRRTIKQELLSGDWESQQDSADPLS